MIPSIPYWLFWYVGVVDWWCNWVDERCWAAANKSTKRIFVMVLGVGCLETAVRKVVFCWSCESYELLLATKRFQCRIYGSSNGPMLPVEMKLNLPHAAQAATAGRKKTICCSEENRWYGLLEIRNRAHWPKSRGEKFGTRVFRNRSPRVEGCKLGLTIRIGLSLN